MTPGGKAAMSEAILKGTGLVGKKNDVANIVI